MAPTAEIETIVTFELTGLNQKGRLPHSNGSLYGIVLMFIVSSIA